MRKISQEHTTEFLKTLSSDVYHSVSDELTKTLNVAMTVANDHLLIDVLYDEDEVGQEATSQKLASYTSHYMKMFSYLWVFIVSDDSMAYYTDEGLYRILDPENEPDDAWYKEFVDSNKEYSLSIGRDNDSPDTWTVFVDARIENDRGEFLGVCGMALEIYNLQALIRDYEEEYGIDIVFIDAEGQPQIENGDVTDYSSKIYTVPDKTNLEQIVVEKNPFKLSYTINKYIEDLDWYMIIHNINPYDYTADYMTIGLNVLIFMVVLIVSLISLRHISVGAGTLFTESYKDTLTGLFNRRAYDDHLNTLATQENLSNITVLVFDVNGLKRVNDTMGHSAGDELIRGTADVIQEYFGSFGKCYRTGGDEFVAIIDKPIEDMDALVASFEAALTKWRGQYVKELSVSYGIVKGKDNKYSIEEMIFHADEQMYMSKNQYYDNSENDRRRR
jgi:diguanylate cyclase (GGDEF)-like protein